MTTTSALRANCAVAGGLPKATRATELPKMRAEHNESAERRDFNGTPLDWLTHHVFDTLPVESCKADIERILRMSDRMDGSSASVAPPKWLVLFVGLLGVAGGTQQFLLGALSRQVGIAGAAGISMSVALVALGFLGAYTIATNRKTFSIEAGSGDFQQDRGREALIALALLTLGAGYLWAFGQGHQWYLYTPGLLGLSLVTGLAYAVPRLGAGATFAGVVAGSMAASLTFDGFGILGLHSIPITPLRILGAVALIAGVTLVIGVKKT